MTIVRSHHWSMYVGFHCLFLDDGANNAVVEPDQEVGFVSSQAGSVSVYTGLALGWVDVRIEVFDAPIDASDGHDAAQDPVGSGGWAEWAEVSVPPGLEPFFRLHATADQVSDEQLVDKPSGGAIRMRVLANGRVENWDAAEPDVPEEYLIQIWPEDSLRAGRSWPEQSRAEPESPSPDYLAALAAARSEAERPRTSLDQPQRAPD